MQILVFTQRLFPMCLRSVRHQGYSGEQNSPAPCPLQKWILHTRTHAHAHTHVHTVSRVYIYKKQMIKSIQAWKLTWLWGAEKGELGSSIYPQEVMTELVLEGRVGTQCKKMGEEGVRADRTCTQFLVSAISFPLMSFWLWEVGKKLHFLECLCRSVYIPPPPF